MQMSSLLRIRVLNFVTLALCFYIAYGALVANTLPLLAIAAAIVVAQCLSVYYVLAIRGELRRMASVVSSLARGDFEARLTRISEKGVLGELQWKLNEMVDTIDAFVREATAAMEYVSRNQYFRRIFETGMQGNLLNGARIINRATQNVEGKMKGFIEVANDLDASLNDVVMQINKAAGNLTGCTTAMRGSVIDTGKDVDSAMRDSRSVSVSVQTISAAAEQMSGCISEIAQQMEKTSGVVRVAMDETGRARVLVGDLSQWTEKISEVSGVIKRIAGQTNLLALNAAIEAARAEDAGKGFAVVAGEVKNLAEQTDQATETIATLVEQINDSVARVVQVFRAVDAVIAEVNTVSAIVAAAIEEQSTASREVAASAGRASSDTNNVAGNVMDINRNITRIGEATDDAVLATQELSHHVVGCVQSLLEKMNVFMVELRKLA